jgi:hypothetical protein
LRSALIENRYDHWQDGNQVMPHDRIAAKAAAKRLPGNVVNYPALYGRFQNSPRAAAMVPPANTLALNPYVRPQSAVRAGEVPHGATLLTTVRQSPGGGRDIYAAKDGQVYLRKNDGWYRRQSGGNWNYVAPLQGTADRNRVAPAAQSVQHPDTATSAQNARAQALADRTPNAGASARQMDVTALEREHAARSLGQQRQQSYHPAGGNVRSPSPVRPGGGGRRR